MNPVQTVSSQVVLAAIPTGIAMRFDPDAAGDLDAVLELRIAGTGTSFALEIADGRCRVQRRSAPEATAGVTISAGDIVRLISGVVQWPVLLADKRLELSGDPFLALRFPTLFGLGS